MASRGLNQRQVEVLGWIADGCPDARQPGPTYKKSAAALQDHHLVTISKHGGWHATLTEDGRHCLEHGIHSRRAVHQGETAAVDTPARVPPAAEPSPVPVSLATDPRKKRASSAEAVAAVQALSRDDRPRGVQGPTRVRALELLGDLAERAVERGWSVAAVPLPAGSVLRQRADSGDHLSIDTGEYRARVRVTQEKDRSPHAATPAEIEDSRRNKWVRIPKYDQVPSRRLRLDLGRNYWGEVRQYSWGDGKVGNLSDKLGAVLDEIALRHGEQRLRRIERERVEAEAATCRRILEIEATALFREEYRADCMLKQATDWAHAAALRQYLDAVAEAMGAMEDEDSVERAREWLEWGRQYVERLDPLAGEIAPPAGPTPSREQLAPFLRIVRDAALVPGTEVQRAGGPLGAGQMSWAEAREAQAKTAPGEVL